MLATARWRRAGPLGSVWVCGTCRPAIATCFGLRGTQPARRRPTALLCTNFACRIRRCVGQPLPLAGAGTSGSRVTGTLGKARHAGQAGSPAPAHRRGSAPADQWRMRVRDTPGGTSAPAFLPDGPGVLAYHRRDNVPGQIRAQKRPPGPSAKITQGARPCEQEPTMQPNTLNTHHDTDRTRSRPSCWRHWPAPWPRRSSRHREPPRRPNGRARGLPDRRAARAAAGRLPGDGPAAGDRRGAAAHHGVPGTRKTTRRYPRRFAEEFAASGLEVADLAAFATAWRARVTAPAR